ncbi:MAG: acyl-CoA reductase [Eubacteriales bacterium]
MILYKGKLYESSCQDRLLESLPDDLTATLEQGRSDPRSVCTALAKLRDRILAGEFDEIISSLDIDGIEHHVRTLTDQLHPDALIWRLKNELGENPFGASVHRPPVGRPLGVRSEPLGVLLHIAAGNVDGLPALSVAEGLITGNINILKLPSADKGLSVLALQKLIESEPSLADYIYVFDTPSTDLLAIRKMAELADGIVTWGGDEAVTAVRRFAPTGCRLIEWGHKLSFAYISGYENKEEELSALAEHIIVTKQLLCNSCQTVFLDTENMEEIHAFCADFLPHLEDAARRHPSKTVGGAAEITLLSYKNRLEQFLSDESNPGQRVYPGYECRLIACEDSELVLSGMFGSCPVKRLPESRLIAELRRKKGYLQSVALICEPQNREALTDRLARAGLCRIMRAGDLSAAFCGEVHDGEYPLRRYRRFVNFE